MNHYTRLVDHTLDVLDAQPLGTAQEDLRAGILGEPRIRGREVLELILDAGKIFTLRA